MRELNTPEVLATKSQNDVKTLGLFALYVTVLVANFLLATYGVVPLLCVILVGLFAFNLSFMHVGWDRDQGRFAMSAAAADVFSQ